MSGHRPLAQLLWPQSVAVVGASPDPSRIGGRILTNLLRHPYGGRVYPVHPQHRHIAGLPVVPSITELPEAPDVTVLAVGAERAVAAVEELGKIGGRTAIVLAGGFDETPSGEDLATRLRRAAEEAGIVLVGPNSQGIWNVANSLVLAFGSEAARSNLIDGPVGIIAHSGSLGGAIARRLQTSKVGLRYFISAGNEANLTLADYLECLLEDDELAVIAAYVEAVRKADRLVGLIQQAGNKGVDVVLLQAGLSETGQATVASHTGAMTGEPELLRDLTEQHGAVVVDSVRELYSAIATLATTPHRFAAPQIGMLGISGGMLALMVDVFSAERVALPRLSPETVDALRSRLPEYATLKNPVDLTGAVVEHEGWLLECIGIVGGDPAVDLVVVGLDNRGYERLCKQEDEFATAARRLGKPLVLALWDPPDQRSVDTELRLRQAGVTIADDPADVGVTIRALTRRSRPSGSADLPAMAPIGDMSRWTSQRRLAAFLGLEVPPTLTLDSPEQLGQAALDHLRPPLVVKPQPNLVRHKTDQALVITGLCRREDVQAAIAKVSERLPKPVPIIVQEQVNGVELLVAVRRDVNWGPILTIGAGGTLVELLRDTTHLPIPATEKQIVDSLQRTTVWSMLSGYRNAPRDIDPVVTAAFRLQRVLIERSDLNEIELNPVIVRGAGEGAFYVDLLVS